MYTIIFYALIKTRYKNCENKMHLSKIKFFYSSTSALWLQRCFKFQSRNFPRASGEKSSEAWGGFPKLPHLSGKSKPLHRRNTTGHAAADGMAEPHFIKQFDDAQKHV